MTQMHATVDGLIRRHALRKVGKSQNSFRSVESDRFGVFTHTAHRFLGLDNKKHQSFLSLTCFCR